MKGNKMSFLPFIKKNRIMALLSNVKMAHPYSNGAASSIRWSMTGANLQYLRWNVTSYKLTVECYKLQVTTIASFFGLFIVFIATVFTKLNKARLLSDE